MIICWEIIKPRAKSKLYHLNRSKPGKTAGLGLHTTYAKILLTMFPYFYAKINLFFLPSFQILQIFQFFFISPRKDGKPIPGFWIDIKLIQMKRRGNTLPFPLISCPKPVKFSDIFFQQTSVNAQLFP